jgi:hypothetical protein
MLRGVDARGGSSTIVRSGGVAQGSDHAIPGVMRAVMAGEDLDGGGDNVHEHGSALIQAMPECVVAILLVEVTLRNRCELRLASSLESGMLTTAVLRGYALLHLTLATTSGIMPYCSLTYLLASLIDLQAWIRLLQHKHASELGSV